jgi:hypothetical protein
MAERTVSVVRKFDDEGNWHGFWNVLVTEGEKTVTEDTVNASSKAEAEIAARSIVAELEKTGSFARGKSEHAPTGPTGDNDTAETMYSTGPTGPTGKHHDVQSDEIQETKKKRD